VLDHVVATFKKYRSPLLEKMRRLGGNAVMRESPKEEPLNKQGDGACEAEGYLKDRYLPRETYGHGRLGDSEMDRLSRLHHAEQGQSLISSFVVDVNPK
jgi:hypothetical protein